MIIVKDAADTIYKTLFHISFNLRTPRTTNSEKFLLMQSDLEQALDSIQHLADNYTNTPDTEFNKCAYKILGATGSYLYYYYQGGTRYIDRWTYMYKYMLDCTSISNAALFFRERYINENEFYLVMLECPENDIFQFSITNNFSKEEIENFIIMPLCLFTKKEIIKVKHISDSKYTSLEYTPTQLLSTLKFAKNGDRIITTVDNSKWEDSAWDL